MTWLRLVASVAPRYALRVMQARRAVAAYEAAEQTRTHRHQREARGPNEALRGAQRSILEQARSLEQNSDIGEAVLQTLEAHVVGTGIRPEPMVRSQGGELMDDVNGRLVELHAEWSEAPEVTRAFAEPEAQRIALRSLMRDGEVFVHDVIGTAAFIRHRGPVPYSYELLESELVPMDLDEARESRQIIQGVEVNTWREAVGYHVHYQHPYDWWGGSSIRQALSTKYVPATRMRHLALRRRVGQIRGVSVFAPVLRRIRDLDEIDETERTAARIAACAVLSIERGDPSIYEPPSNPDGTPLSDGGYREIEFAPGMTFDLPPGERMNLQTSNRPNPDLIAFRREQLRGIAGGAGVGVSMISRAWEGNFSAQRQELSETRALYGMLHAYFVARSERPKWRSFVRAARLAGLVSFRGADPRTIEACQFSRPASPWIDPQKEAAAYETLLGLGLTSRSRIMRERGEDPREVERELAIEAARRAEQSDPVLEEEGDDEDEPADGRDRPGIQVLRGGR